MNAPQSQLAADTPIAFDEAEAARQLGLPEHVLRDERLHGRITAARIAGGRIRYSRSDLDGYLTSNRFKPHV